MARQIRGSGRRTDKQWGFMPSGVTSLTTATTVIAPGGLSFSEPGTIMRCRGSMFLGISAATAAGDEAKVAFGLALVSTDAFDAGSGSMPDPAAEPDYPWLWWTQETIFSPFVIDGTGSDDSSGRVAIHIPIDTKAMRKVKPRMTLAMVSQYVDISGTPALRWATNAVRVLVGT